MGWAWRWCSARVLGHTPSRSSQKLILVWPRPMVYFPALTPSCFSSSVCSTYCFAVARQQGARGCCGGGWIGVRGRGDIGRGRGQTHLAGGVDLDGLDANVLGAGRHGCELVREMPKEKNRQWKFWCLEGMSSAVLCCSGRVGLGDADGSVQVRVLDGAGNSPLFAYPTDPPSSPLPPSPCPLHSPPLIDRISPTAKAGRVVWTLDWTGPVWARMWSCTDTSPANLVAWCREQGQG